MEVATLRALENFSGKNFSGTELAKLAQRAENEIVGAPCGLMDQLASAHGVADSLLPILCRPDILRAPISLPDGVLVAGWLSGVKHAVSDSPYAVARCTAFMGKKILEKHFGRELKYLTELAPSQAWTRVLCPLKCAVMNSCNFTAAWAMCFPMLNRNEFIPCKSAHFFR